MVAALMLDKLAIHTTERTGSKGLVKCRVEPPPRHTPDYRLSTLNPTVSHSVLSCYVFER
jgi:hypothetical protein